MSEQESESHEAPPEDEPLESPPQPEKRPDFLAYQGAKVPLLVVLLWMVFLIWGVVYFVYYVPESWSEWFRRD